MMLYSAYIDIIPSYLMVYLLLAIIRSIFEALVVVCTSANALVFLLLGGITLNFMGVISE